MEMGEKLGKSTAIVLDIIW